MIKTILALIISIASPFCLCAKVVKQYLCNASGSIDFVIDSIDYRSDVTRVYGKLKGQPHTSNRIDKLAIRYDESAPAECTDIDGVDMHRWFQWEESGLIEVEIDFPTGIPSRRIEINALCAKGESIWIIQTKESKTKTSKRTGGKK